MGFFEVINQAAKSAPRDNLLQDGQLGCRYGELPGLLGKIDAALDRAGMRASDCLSVECPATLPGALTLLALLRRGTSFLLSPPDPGQLGIKPTPPLCAHRLTVHSPGAAAPMARLSVPESFLHTEPNPRYNGAAIAGGKLLLRTSGSLGASKIVVHDHARLIGNARNCVERYRFSPSDRVLVPVPIAHMYGLGAELLPAILVGASIELLHGMNLLRYLDREKRFAPTLAFGTPTLIAMLHKGWKAPRTSYRVFVTSGQHIEESLFRGFDALVGGKLINQYGSTEMGAIAACHVEDDQDRRAATLGAPMAGVSLRIGEGDEAVPADGRGELFCHHPYGFEGYLDDSGAWLKRAPGDGWYATGDLAASGPDGVLVLCGRVNASVNRSGYLVLLSDIERVMAKLDAIAEVAVVAGAEEGRHGRKIAAFCVARTGEDVDAQALRERCFEVLPRHAIPDEVQILSALPTLPTGKVDRQGLAARVVA